MIKKILGMPLIQSLLLTALILSGMLWAVPPLMVLDHAHYDFWSARYHQPDEPSIAIVAIDEQSIRRIGDWPWPRNRIAEMVQWLSDAGAEALGICLLYTQPEINPGRVEIQELQTAVAEPKFKGDRKTIQTLSRMLDRSEQRLNHDQQLITAIRRARNSVLPFRFSYLPTNPLEVDDKPTGLLIINSLKAPANPGQTDQNLMTEAAGLRDRHLAHTVPVNVRQTFPELAGKAGALGHMNLIADPDGKVRRIPQLIQFEGRLYPSMALQLALKTMGTPIRDLSIVQDAYGQPKIKARRLQLPTDPAYRMLLNHDPLWTRKNTYAFTDVLDGNVAKEAFKDKIILIGITDPYFSPTFRMGKNAGIPRVEITANALARILSSSWLSRPSWALLLEIVVLLYFAGMLTFVFPRVNLRVGASMLLFFVATWYAASVGLLLGYGYWIKPYGPVLLAAVGFVMIQFTTYSIKRQQEKLDSCKTLGLSYQGQGMLDMAYEQYMQCPVKEKTVKNLLYNLALDFERKRMFNRAMAIYRHIRTAGAFKDIKKRIGRLKTLDDPLSAKVAASKGDPTLQMDDTDAKPVFGRYEILSELGHGAMGTVYLGRDPKINRKVAIKTLPYGDVEDSELPEVKTRFFREAEAAGKLSHPNIVAIYDAGEEHDMAYIAMELLKGEDLTHYRKPGTLLPVGRVLTIIADVTAALDYAHRQKVIHRDIKPGNIMLLKDGRVKVTDFGIARVVDSTATKTGIILGTPSYMSPEQVADKELDGRSDLFALGIVFYELLTGKKPFKGDNISATMHAILHGTYPPLSKVVPEIPTCIEAVVRKMLAKGLSKRYRSSAQALKAIEACRSVML